MSKLPKKMVRKQHWVPQFYLRHFADSSGKLHTYSKSNDKFFATKTENLCAQRDLYEVNYTTTARGEHDEYYAQNLIEKKLSEFEGRLAPLYKQLLECCDEEVFDGERFHEGRAAACALAANLIVRHPESMREDCEIEHEIELVLHKVINLTEHENEMLNQTQWHNDYPAVAKLIRSATALFPFDERAPFNRTYKAFYEKQFSVLKAPVGMGFITTSMPMFIIGPEDDSYEFAFAYFPLSEKYVAIFSDMHQPFPASLRLDYAGVISFNKLLLLNCKYWDYAMSRVEGRLDLTIRDWKIASQKWLQ